MVTNFQGLSLANEANLNASSMSKNYLILTNGRRKAGCIHKFLKNESENWTINLKKKHSTAHSEIGGLKSIDKEIIKEVLSSFLTRNLPFKKKTSHLSRTAAFL